MRKFLTLSVVIIVAMILACGGGGGGATTTPAKGEAKHVAEFLDNIFQKGNLNAAFEKLASQERAMVGMMPGFYDFLTGKQSEAVSEEMRLLRVVIDEMVPVPDNIIKYEIGDPIGEGDTLTVPVTFSVPEEDMEEFLKEHIDEETYEKMDNLDKLDIPFEEKKKVIHDAISQAKSAVKGKTFAMQTNTNNFTLIKQDGEWRISILASGLMDAFGGGF